MTTAIRAVLVLILAVLVALHFRQRPAATGIPATIAFGDDCMGDGYRNLILDQTQDDRIKLNGEAEQTVSETVHRLHEIMRTRLGKEIYVKAANDVSWAGFIDMLDHVRSEVETISILTPTLQKTCEGCCLSPGRPARRLIPN